jgi:hypothetical protein
MRSYCQSQHIQANTIFHGDGIEGMKNILNSRKNSDIRDNTINLVVFCHADQNEELASKKLSAVCTLDQFVLPKINHHWNGIFLVSQQSLS